MVSLFFFVGKWSTHGAFSRYFLGMFTEDDVRRFAWQTSQTSVVSWCFGIIGIWKFGVFRSDGNGIKTQNDVASQFIAVKEWANDVLVKISECHKDGILVIPSEWISDEEIVDWDRTTFRLSWHRLPRKKPAVYIICFPKKNTAFSLGCKVFRNSDCIPDFSRASFDWSIWDGQNQKTICKMCFFPMQIIHFSIEINGIQNSA